MSQDMIYIFLIKNMISFSRKKGTKNKEKRKRKHD